MNIPKQFDFLFYDFLWFAAQFQSLSKFIRNWKRIIDKANQLWAEFGPLRPTERVASQPKKAWMAGCISEKFEVFFTKRTERGCWTAGWFRKKFRVFFQNFLREEVGLRVDFCKVRGFFCKMTGKRKIQTVRPADRTAGKSGRRGHAHRPGNWPGFVGKDEYFVPNISQTL